MTGSVIDTLQAITISTLLLRLMVNIGGCAGAYFNRHSMPMLRSAFAQCSFAELDSSLLI